MSIHLTPKRHEFYIEVALKLQEHFPIGDPVIKMLQVLGPDTTRVRSPSLVPLAMRFQKLIPISISCNSLTTNGTTCLLLPYHLTVRIWI